MPKRCALCALMAALWSTFTPGSRVRAEQSSQPPDPLVAVDQAFLSVYEQAKSAVLKDVSPILIVLGDRLVVYRNRTRSELPYPLTTYTKLKSVAHIPLALFVLFTATGEDPLSQQHTEEVERFD